MHFPAPLIHALDELAGKLHISRSELVRRSCQNALSMRSEADADPTAQSGR
jgi:metal-responsive CopG/Arc/MetJ family transcriptional regulator